MCSADRAIAEGAKGSADAGATPRAAAVSAEADRTAVGNTHGCVDTEDRGRGKLNREPELLSAQGVGFNESQEAGEACENEKEPAWLSVKGFAAGHASGSEDRE